MHCVGLDMTQPVRDRSGNDGRQSICAVPSRHSDRLLSSTIPLIRYDAEKWQATSLKQAKEESSCK